jgi:glutaredoxin
VTHVVLYGKSDCELCDEMKAVVEEVRRDVPFTFDIVDIEGDAALRATYGMDVPVLVVDGRKAFKHRLDAVALRRRLAR